VERRGIKDEERGGGTKGKGGD
jgi:hypothetical protein